ncbi:MAG: hypothetical protein ABSA70_15545 [Terriglobia bacterium]
MILALASMLVVGAAQPSAQSQGDTSHPPTDPEARALLKAICPEGIRTHRLGGERLYVACQPCPDFTSRALTRAGRRDFFNLETVIYGSFTAPGAREAIGGFDGCEDHTTTANFRSSVLLRKGPHGWRKIAYERFETSQCRDYRLPGGRDVLLCQGLMGHADESAAWVFTYDFADPEGQNERDLFGVINTWGACGATAIVGSIDKFELRDLDHDGMPDVSIHATVIEEEASGPQGVCAADFSPPPGKTYQIDFLFQQGKFVVAPWSAEMKHTLDETFKAAR